MRNKCYYIDAKELLTEKRLDIVIELNYIKKYMFLKNRGVGVLNLLAK